MDALVEVEGLTKRYGKIEALKEVSLTVTEGVTGLIGPNGSGKTTLIKLILGLIKPTEGRIRVFDVDPWRRGKFVRSRIGVLHEKPRFPNWATGIDFLKFVAELRGVSNPEREAEEMLRLVGLSDDREKRIGEYSAGMTQRLGLAQAIIGYPPLIILDEPTANLDPKGRVEILDLIEKIHEERNVSFLISTHILPELERVCQNIIILNQGRVIDMGGLKSLAEKYHAYNVTIKPEKPLELMETLKTSKYVKNITLKGDEITLNTSSMERLTEELGKTEIKISYVRENPGLLERIYIEATKSV